MADIRIKDLATTASTTALDDFMAVDGTTNGTRKLSAATPSFATSVTVPSVVGPTSTNLTLAGGSTSGQILFNSPSATERARLTNTGNLLIGTTTDISGTGGLKVAGTSTASSTTSGALQVAGGVGVVGNVVAGGFTFGTTPNASYPFYAAGSTAGTPVSMRISHSDGTNATSNARIILDTASGGGDPFINFISGAVEWSLGVDNSASDVFKLSRSGAIGTTDALTIDGSNAATFAGAVTVNGTGTSTISSATTGAAGLMLRNTAAGTGNYGILGIGNDSDANAFNIITFSSTYSGSGANTASFSRIENNRASAGLNLVAGGASGTVNIYAGGEGAGSKVATFSSTLASAFAGAVSVSSTTAGSAGAGALVVSGGLATGAASYFGGKVTSAASTATGYNQLFDTTGITTGRGAFAITSTGAGLAFGIEASVGGTSFTGSTAYASYFGTTTATPIHFVTNSVIRQTIDSAGAATFAGAVAIGNTVNTVSPTSPNRTVTMVIGGVTYYLAAKTTND